MIRHARSYLVVSVILGALPAAGCVEPGDRSSEASSTLTSTDRVQAIDPATELEASSAVEEVGQGCGRRSTFSLSADADPGTNLLKDLPDAAAACLPPDIYFHPNNGAHGGWIESWRLCYQGGGTYQICTGGSAPVRFWNPSSCGGTVQDFYPQGWHGWAQTGGGCC
jgi:hypothetical protein